MHNNVTAAPQAAPQITIACPEAAQADSEHGQAGQKELTCVGKIPKRFLQVTRWDENLSSGEKRAGCAERVATAWPVHSQAFCSAKQRQREWPRSSQPHAFVMYLERVLPALLTEHLQAATSAFEHRERMAHDGKTIRTPWTHVQQYTRVPNAS
jgi:hypothetical protein